eukprot:3060086-Rhodomonas_salina.3
MQSAVNRVLALLPMTSEHSVARAHVAAMRELQHLDRRRRRGSMAPGSGGGEGAVRATEEGEPVLGARMCNAAAQIHPSGQLMSLTSLGNGPISELA